MMRRRRLLSTLLALSSVLTTAQAQQFAAPSAAPPYAPSAAPVWGDARDDARRYDAAIVGERYATPAAYQAYSPGGGVVHAAAQRELDQAPPVPTLAPDRPEDVPSPPAPAATAIPIAPSTSFRVDELVGIAMSYNPILRREQAQVEQAKGERLQAGLYVNPYFFTNNPEVFAGQNSIMNFGFYQVIPVKGKKRLEKAAADQGVRRETADYRLERADLLTDVRQQFYSTLAAKHRVYLARHLATIAERAVGGARQLERAGEGTLTDVLLLDTGYQRAQIRLQNAETTYEYELKQLAAVVGAPGLVIEDVQGSLFDRPPVFDEQDVQAFIVDGSSYAERARADITNKQIELRRAEVDPYPDLKIGPHYNVATYPGGTQFWFTVEFDIPVWNLNQGNIRKSSAEVQQSIAQRQVTFNGLHRKVSELFAKHRAARDRAERIRAEILPNAQEAQNLVQDAYVKGVFNVNRLLRSQQNLAAVSSDYFDAAEESWTTAAELAGLLQLEQFP